jgi:hypothetical protein
VTTVRGDDLPACWPDGSLVEFVRTRRTNLRHYGTVTRYAAITSDGTEREVIHGQALERSASATRSVDLTIGTAPPLSLGPEGLVMHFLLKVMEMGVDGLVFGPERSRSDVALDEAEVGEIARRISFASSARAAHLVADRLAVEASTDLSHMLWTGVSLGAMKGIMFSALARERKRTMVYGHFVVPVAPNPIPSPTPAELRQFQWGEFGALIRLSGDLLWHDVRDRTLRIHENVARVSRPGLLWRYARSVPREQVFRVFAAAWRDAVVSGEAGRAAVTLPVDRLTTFELFDRDEGGSPDEWREKLRHQLDGGATRLVVKRGRHTDALRLSHQQERARAIKAVVGAVQAGTPVEQLEHPVG